MMDQNLELSHLLLFAQSIGIGFLIGLERERHENAVAGLRTFTLIALAGSLGGYISKLSANCQSALNPDPLSACKSDPPLCSMEVVPVVHGRAPRGFV